MRRSRPALLAVTAVVAAFLTAVAGATDTAAAAPPPSTAGAFVAMTPTRVLDTRTGVGAPAGPLTPGRALHLTVGGRAGVPTDAAAVVLTLTVVASDATGYLSAYPTAGAVPTASVLNWSAGRTTAGSATVTLGTGGRLDLLARAARPVHLVADVAGWFVAGTPVAAGTYVARTPTRLLDTRRGLGVTAARPLASGDVRDVRILGGGGIIPASGVSAVVGTLTAVSTRTSGYLSVWADGTRPAVSSVNYSEYQTVANQVTVPVSGTGSISLYASGGPVDVVFDATGYIVDGVATAPGTYVPLTPVRISDSRDRPSGAPPANTDFVTYVAGVDGVGVPATDVSAVVANLTVTDTSATGYLTVWPFDRPRPTASNLNWTAGQTVANQATVTLGRYGRVNGLVAGTAPADVVVDVFGYYRGVPPPSPTGLTASTVAPGTPRQAVMLHWSGSAAADGYTVRRSTGSTPPDGPEAGDLIADLDTTTVTDEDVQPGTSYSYSVFARDPVPTYSASAATLTLTVPVLEPGPLGLGHAVEIAPPPGESGSSFSITGLECPAAGHCVAVGTFHTPVTDGRAVVLVQSGTTWTTTFAPLPADGVPGGPSRLNAIDCSGVDACVAVGQYPTASALGVPLVVRIDGGRVTPETASPADASASDIAAAGIVACPTSAACQALGSYVSAARGAPTVLALTADASGTHAATSPVPVALSSPSPRAVSCAGPSECIAVGSWGSADGRTTNGLTGRWNGSRWTWSDLPRPTGTVAGSFQLGAVSCPAVGACVATGTATTTAGDDVGVRATLTGRTWTTATLPAVSGYGGHVRCLADGSCVATFSAAAGVTTVGPAPGATTGATVPAPTGVDAARVGVYDLACDTALVCVAPGSWTSADRGRTRAMVTAIVAGVPTSYQVGPELPSDTYTVAATRVGCAPDRTCVLSGSYGPSGQDHAFLETFRLPQ